MSSATIVVILLNTLINIIIILISQSLAIDQCDLSGSVNLQSATYTHSLILRVQPILTSEQNHLNNNISSNNNNKKIVISKVLVREVIKISTLSSYQHHHQVKMNDLIIIRINDDDEMLDDTCWHLLRMSNVDMILFLNETNTNEFYLHYPPVESTLRVRQNIDDVLNHETYSPQVIVKTQIDRPTLSYPYSLQCNSRGNPLPRLLWSKKKLEISSESIGIINETLHYYPLIKHCQIPCRIYSTQNRYQSTLHFQYLITTDNGIYVCHAENPMNRTAASIHLNIISNNSSSSIRSKNVTCANLNYCHDRGHCIIVHSQFKCLCDNRYFGEQCEMNYDDVMQKQDSAILLFKSRFFAGCVLAGIGFILVLCALISWMLAKQNRRRQQHRRQEEQDTMMTSKLQSISTVEKPLISPGKEKISPLTINGTIPSVHSVEQPNAQPEPCPEATVFINHSPLIEEPPSSIIRMANIRPIFTRESSATTDDDDEPMGDEPFWRNQQSLPPVPTTIDEEYEERFSLKMNNSEEYGLSSVIDGTKTNDLILSKGYLEFYQPDAESGLIRPLNTRSNAPERLQNMFHPTLDFFYQHRRKINISLDDDDDVLLLLLSPFVCLLFLFCLCFCT